MAQKRFPGGRDGPGGLKAVWVEAAISPQATYRGLALDRFQIQAIEHIETGASVLVSAPTGTGKTVVADYVVEKMAKEGRRVVYTAPIKALSNQKFKEFKRLLGEERVGILTGDVVVRPDAPTLIMTTEIFRNLLHTDRERVADVAYVIFDEIHYIDDPERGSVWEESLIFMPPEMRFLGLSATIPNVDELAAWIEGVQGRPVKVVRHAQRAVPLEHHLFEASAGVCSLALLERRYRRMARRLGVLPDGRLAGAFPPTSHLALIDEIAPALLPCLFFTFSRRRCEAHATELAERRDFLSPAEKAAVAEVIERQYERYGGAGRLEAIRPLLMRGIGYHHAGLLPLVKDIVEELFESRLIRVLYCTETFAVGLNFPCKTVCFDGVTKWDGTEFRPLTNREYFQMAGRAGRRGIDEKGYVFTLVDFNFFEPRSFPTMREADVEPLQSRFSLTYNTVLNLIYNYDEDEIEAVLQKNFASYQSTSRRQALESEVRRLEEALAATSRAVSAGRGAHKRKGRRGAAGRKLAARWRAVRRELAALPPRDAFRDEFRRKRALLDALDYLRGEELTARGLFARQVNGQELLITEFFCSGVFHDWDLDQLAALATSIGYEPRRHERRAPPPPFDLRPIKRAITQLEEAENRYVGTSSVRFNEHLAEAAYRWSRGARFFDLLRDLQVDEGDLAFAFRRAIDILRQVRHAAREDGWLASRLSEAIARMDRDEVSIFL
ncbi:MAG TPA: DEAD/DEAH box helicase [Limnochordia bacterium]